VVLTASPSREAPNAPSKAPMNSRVHARNINEATVAMAPPRMNGRRLPNLERHWSDLIPTYGCTRTPESGPAIQTRASKLFDRPKLRRYGLPLESSTAQASCSLFTRQPKIHPVTKVLRFADPPREMVSKMRYQLLLLSGAAARMSAFHGALTPLLA
jgi:hypothetical protein